MQNTPLEPTFTKEHPTAIPSQTSRKTVAIHLINPDEMDSCPFWIGVFHKGSTSPQELFNFENVDTAFEKAARDGLAEDGPVMLSDSSKEPARFHYLMPEPGHDSRRRQQWIQQLCDTVSSWAPKGMGIYLAPNLVNQRLMQEVVAETLKFTIQHTTVTDYYFQTATHGINTILNTTLRVRSELANLDIEAFVFH